MLKLFIKLVTFSKFCRRRAVCETVKPSDTDFIIIHFLLFCLWLKICMILKVVSCVIT
jgi:hypothetical protein